MASIIFVFIINKIHIILSNYTDDTENIFKNQINTFIAMVKFESD